MGLICRLFGHREQEDGVCKRCKTARGSQGLKFKRSKDKTSYMLTSAAKCCDEHVVVPKQYKGLPVSEISDRAFFGNATAVDILLPDTVTRVGSFAFANTSVRRVVFSDTPCRLEQGVFSGCQQLEQPCLPVGTTTIAPEAFADCTALREVHLPHDVVSVDTGAFRGCSALHSFTYDRQDLTLGASAFEGCSSLAHFRLPGNLTTLPARLLWGCKALTELALPETLTRIEPGALCGCAGLTELALPSTLTAIGAQAFRDCTGIARIELPSSLTELLPDETGLGDIFRGCTSLQSVTLCPSLLHYPAGMFADCSALSDIMFDGKSPQWRAIRKDDGWDAGSACYVVHCINGRIRKGS